MSRQSKDKGRALGAIGVVFGDIGTSPLYALPAALFLINGRHSHEYAYGTISMILWAVTLIVSIKYVWLIAKADNHGEGGVMALLALVRRVKPARRTYNILVGLALVGMALFFGDSVITPAISVLSAVEGLRGAVPSLTPYIVPIAIAVLTLLFVLQSRGTRQISRIFGPVMVLWFSVIGIAGLLALVANPSALIAILPTTALGFIFGHPDTAFLLLGAVVLAITGAEALYADMGHFGRSAVRRSWFSVVFPALILNYLGQAALLGHSTAGGATTPFFGLFSGPFQLPAVILATCATLIASQSVIAGAFSLTRQAIRLGFMPRMLVRYTSDEKGQVYLGGINWLLYVLVLMLVLGLGSSERLAEAYGMAVSGTLLIDSLLFVCVMEAVWHIRRIWTLLFAVIFVSIEVFLVASNASKIIHGAWIPLVLASAALAVMASWTIGHRRLAAARKRLEETAEEFVDEVGLSKLHRIPGLTVYLSAHANSAPAGLRTMIERFRELPNDVLIVVVRTENVPHVPAHERIKVDDLEQAEDGIVQVILRFGFNDIPNIPLALEHNESRIPEIKSPVHEATYVVSNTKPVVSARRPLRNLWKHFFVLLERNARNPSDYFHLPPEHTIDMVSHVEI